MKLAAERRGKKLATRQSGSHRHSNVSRQLTNGNQAILARPLPNPSHLVAVVTPVLPRARLGGVQHLFRAVGGDEGEEDVAVFSRLLGRARGLVFHHVVEGLELHRFASGTDLRGRGCCDPVAELGPFGVVPGRRIRVGEGDDQARLLGRAVGWVGKDERGRVLEVRGLERVSELGLVAG